MDIQNVIDTLTPWERKILPLLAKQSSLADIIKATGLPEIQVMRALQWLSGKGIINLAVEVKQVITLGKNGYDYLNKGLPEKRLLAALKEKALHLDELANKSGLERQELAVSLGLLKQKAAISIDKGNVSITEQGKKLLSKETLEEQFLKKLSKGMLDLKSLSQEEKFAYDNFAKRKEIVKMAILKIRKASMTDLGIKAVKIKITSKDSLDRLTSDMLAKGTWKGKSFRRYDVKSAVPKIYAGKRHFVREATDYAKKVWMDLGFKEMKGPILNTSFWNFDALFTAQDHPARELQDTFYIGDPAKGSLPDKKLVDAVRKSHEEGVSGSTGWRYKWNPEEAKRNVMRTHTSVLSAHTLAALKKEDIPAKFFSVGRCYRNEAVDWSHLFEFNQSEGIVVDPDANFRHLLGYLRQFFSKMGFPKARFRPAYFPYTEPSVEIDVFHPVHKQWIELGGAGMFRPELIVPLLGEDIPVLAWGPGFDRIIMDYYKLTDLRDLYKNDLKQIRAMKSWMRW
jgi:phenylalanyl-tRNA synthetase alpha chain